AHSHPVPPLASTQPSAMPRPLFSFSFSCSLDHRDLHSFPTRRSSDLRRSDAGSVPRRSPCVEAVRRARGSTALRCCSSTTFSHGDRKSTRLNSSHVSISYAVFCLKKKKTTTHVMITESAQVQSDHVAR